MQLEGSAISKPSLLYNKGQFINNNKQYENT